MSKSNLVMIATALFCACVSGCQAGKDASSDTTKGQSAAPPATASAPADTAAAAPGKPGAPSPAKAAQAPKAQGAVSAPTAATKAEAAKAEAAAAAAARADSIRLAQDRAEALKNARLDSARQADAAKTAAKPAPPAPRAEPVAPAGPDLVAQGKGPYEDNCRRCHGVRGVPPKAMKTKLPKIATFDADFFAKHSADSIVTVLMKGKGEDMTSFSDKLSRSEMRAVAAYIRTFVQP